MSERQDGPYDSIARRWLALVERRQEHFIELHDSGRWRHYYTKEEFLDEMRKVLRVRDKWAKIAGLPPSGDARGEAQPTRVPGPTAARHPSAALPGAVETGLRAS